MTHVANAFKYATGIIVVFASTNKRSGGSSVLFWASVLLNSLYSFYWDIRMDWGLFTSTRTIIRENRRYDKVWYYVAVALDFVLRISWSLKLSASYGLLFDGEYSSLLSQVLELFRRTMWTCIRVEYVLSLSLSLSLWLLSYQHQKWNRYEDVRKRNYKPVSTTGGGNGKGDDDV